MSEQTIVYKSDLPTPEIVLYGEGDRELQIAYLEDGRALLSISGKMGRVSQLFVRADELRATFGKAFGLVPTVASVPTTGDRQTF